MKDGKPDKPRTCPICGHKPLEPRSIRDEFVFGGEDGDVTVVAENVPVHVCTNCGEILSGAPAALIRHDAICRTLGLLTPAEIRALRGRVGMTEEQFADWVGVPVDVVPRWERSHWVQTRAYDRLMRMLEEFRFLRQAVDAVPEAKRAFDALRATG